MRTDRLVRSDNTASGTERLLTFHDHEGRRLGITATELRENRSLARQVAEDVRQSIPAGLDVDDRTRQLLGLPEAGGR